MTARVIDFDAFRREQEAAEGKQEDPPAMVIGGKTYVLPPDLPATVAVSVIRMQKDRGAKANVPPEMLAAMGDALFGKDEFNEILETQRLGVRGMGDLLTQAFRLYDPDEGKETIPNRKTRRQAGKRSTSSKTGPSSRQTSSGSTISTL